ncbi:MAG: CehA/McbA family metallohydrolase [candidate division Zixibacteria bacterium]|nr:CehA/McbA family metallohydrolase [candidate division Zixibacteria bacterium]
MPDYEPLDISSMCQTDAAFFTAVVNPPAGRQTFRGIPFQIGSGVSGSPLFIGFDTASIGHPLSIPIASRAKRVLFAHTVVESKIPSGGTVGKTIAIYRFYLSNGHVYPIPIRERFEIGYFPPMWGQLPFLCVPDQPDTLIERHRGAWQEAGRRQTEASQAWPGAYYLWAWENPEPDVELGRIEVTPEDQPFLIAGITLGHLAEDPFCRWAVQDVRIDLHPTDAAQKPFDLAVEVDRGFATYPYPLPSASTEAFVNDTHKGWGEPSATSSSPACVGIAGTPSATVSVTQSGETLGTVNWGELDKSRVVDTPKVRFEIVDSGRNWVHTTVLDGATGKPLPCRIHFRSAHGIAYAPHGHHAHVNSDMGTWHIDIGGDVRLGQATYAYIDGKCQGWLPRGDVVVDVARGFEYEPLRTVLYIQPGQRELTLRLNRWIDMSAQRYFSGDTHVHFLSTQGAHLEAEGEGLNVVNLLLSQWGSLFTNTEEFTGRPSVSTGGETIVYATQENRQHMLGHLTLLGLKTPVMPWCSDGPSEGEPGGNLETTLSYWADECHRQGGTVVIPHIPNPNCEPAALIATGRADAVEMLIHSEYNHLEYYRYLNCGYRLPLTGGTDKMTSDVPVGLYRTYVYIPPDEPFTYESWLKGLRSGHTFLSGGPLIRFSVNGHPIGSTVHLTGNGGTVEIEAQVESTLPVHSLEIVNKGKVAASTEERQGTRRLMLKTSLRIDGDTWLAARCAGPNYAAIPHHDGWRRGIMAHTSPIYIACGKDYRLFDLENAHYMLSLVEGGLSYIRHRSAQHPHGNVTHHHGEEDHLAFLEKPYREAVAAIHRRMHDLGIPH